jgi:outer membrane protein assembly factor BamA
MHKRIHLLLLLLSVLLTASARFGLAVEKKQKEKKKDKRISAVVLPVIFYMPETRFGVGGGGLLTYRPKNSPEDARPSSLFFQAYYTQNKQYGIELTPEFYLKNEDYIVSGYFKISKFPNKFWGIGSQTPDEAEEKYTPRMFNFDLTVQRRILKKERLYAGIQYKFENLKILEFEPDGLLSTGRITGSGGGKLSAMGLILNWDTRDNIFFPRSGNFFQMTTNFYLPAFGSDFTFTSLKLDLRKYFPFFKSDVLAVQVLLQSVSGSPTFRHMAEIGGDKIMRGYYGGRYRDKSMIVLQTEYRMKIWKIFGMVVFAGLADVADKLGNLSLGNLKHSVGLGLRITVVPKEGTNIRLDYGFGKGTSGFYIMASEAF